MIEFVALRKIRQSLVNFCRYDDTYYRVNEIARHARVSAMLNSRWLLLGSLLIFALLLNREGDRFPTGNEFVYLLYFYRAWHPTFLATDWTFQEPTAGHAIFNLALGWMTRIMSLQAATWLGRVFCWVATFLGLFRVGRHFKIPPWAVWAGIVLWLLEKQSPVTGEWMVGSFEAKVIAYPCLLFAIDAVLTNRMVLAGVLCGIAFSFHTAVGMWGGAALGFAVLFNQPLRKTLVFSVMTILFSLPGLITSWQLIFGPNRITPEGAKYLTTIALPECFDAATFPHTWMVVLALLPFFAWMFSRWQRGDREIRQLLIFEIALAVFFAFGVFARIIHRFDWVELFPMRVYAVFALLLFFWQGMSICVNWFQKRSVPGTLFGFGAVLFLMMPSPLLGLRDLVGSHLTRYLHPYRNFQNTDRGNDADFIQAARWIADDRNTKPTDVVIAPPWWNDGFYCLNRPLIANWHAPRYDQIIEWRERLESLVGDTSHLDPDLVRYGEMDPRAWAHYASLTSQNISEIQGKYAKEGRAKWLVTTGQYDYPIACRAGTYFVYKLP
jgi:hypothetical protein